MLDAGFWLSHMTSACYSLTYASYYHYLYFSDQSTSLLFSLVILVVWVKLLAISSSVAEYKWYTCIFHSTKI